MGKWFPKFYDTFMSPLERRPSFNSLRHHLIERAQGHVLEIGAGTGINLDLYSQKVSQLLSTDPNPEMVRRAHQKETNSRVPVLFQTADAEHLPFSSDTFDTVVGTLVFCSITKPEIALMELERVLKPGGELLLFEHVQMPQPILQKAQDLLTPIWKQLCDGCHLNRDTLKLIKNSPFHILDVSTVYKELFISIVAQKPESSFLKPVGNLGSSTARVNN